MHSTAVILPFLVLEDSARLTVKSLDLKIELWKLCGFPSVGQHQLTGYQRLPLNSACFEETQVTNEECFWRSEVSWLEQEKGLEEAYTSWHEVCSLCA